MMGHIWCTFQHRHYTQHMGFYRGDRRNLRLQKSQSDTSSDTFCCKDKMLVRQGDHMFDIHQECLNKLCNCHRIEH